MSLQGSRLACVSQALKSALAVDLAERRQAEAFLEREQHEVGFAPLLLRIACLANADQPVQCNAAILFKNTVRSRWPGAVSGVPTAVVLPSEDCYQISTSLLAGMLQAPAAAHKTLAEAASVVAQYDLQRGSDTFLLQLVGSLQTADVGQLLCGLLVLHLLCRRWRSFNYWDNVDAATLALRVMPDAIAALFMSLSQSVRQGNCAHMAPMYTMLKIQRSLMSFPKPPSLNGQPQVFVHELGALLAVPDDEISTGASRVLLVMVRQHIKTVACCIGTVLEASLAKLVQGASGEQSAFCLDILASSCEQLRTWTELAPAILTSEITLIALRDTVLQFSSWNERDSELFASEALQFAKIECHGCAGAFDAASEDRVESTNVRHAAYRLARALGAASWPLLATTVGGLLQDPLPTRQTSGLLLAAAIPAAEEHAADCRMVAERATQILLVDPVAAAPLIVGALQAISAHCVSMSGPAIHSVIGRMSTLLQQADPIPDFAFRCTRQLCEKLTLLSRNDELGQDGVALLQQLLVSITAVVHHKDSTEAAATALVVLSLLRSRSPLATAPVALPVMTALHSAITRLCSRPGPCVVIQNVFECFSILVELHAPGDTSVQSAAEATILPAVQLVVSDIRGEDVSGLSNNVYKAVSQLIVIRQGHLPGLYDMLRPCILHPAAWSNSSNIPALVQLTYGYLAWQPAEMALQTSALLQVMKTLVDSQLNDHEGLRLLGYMFAYLPSPALMPFAQLISTLLVSTLEHRSTTKYERALMIAFSRMIVALG